MIISLMCLLLYGSASGNAADLADVLFDGLRRRNLSNLEYKQFGKATLADLQSHKHIFIVCSTTGQGTLPANAQPFWSSLLRKSLKAPLLSHAQIYSFGLGSSSYPKFNWATRKIHSRLVQLGAQEAVPRGEGDDLGSEPYESIFDQWASMALSNLDSDLQIIDAKPKDELLPPIYPVKMFNAMTPPPSPLQHTRNSILLSAKVVENTRLTGPEHFQDVRHLRLTLDTETPIEAGDVVCLYPSNDDSAVESLLKCQGWEDIADHHIVAPRTYDLAGGWHYPLTLRSLLKWHVDLNSIPRRQFFAIAQHFCIKEQHRERMIEFTTDLDDLFNYTSRPRRSILEVVIEFDSLKIPIEYILDLLPPLRPRQFSISSGPQNPSVIEISASIVKYRTALRRLRRGLCTHWIEQLKPQDCFGVSIEHNRMQLFKRISTGKPCILVATGTGVAPIRSLLQTIANSGQILPKPVLFFGCRFEKEDFLYREELESVANVIPSFSREGGGYVQQSIQKFAADLDIASAFIFVCGSAGAMPRAVRDAFLESLVTQGHSLGDAGRILTIKEKNGEYVQETW